MKYRFLVLAFLASFLVISPAAAQSCAPVCSCTVTATEVAFGAYDTLGFTPHDTTANITVRCEIILVAVGLVPVSYSISVGPGTTGNYSAREMDDGSTNAIGYQLYLDAARTRVWGDGTAGTEVVTGSLLLNPLAVPPADSQSHTVYGRAPAGTSVPFGSYLDSVLVTTDY